MNDRPRLLIVGGYGTFGGRIVQLLEAEARLTLIVAGRSLKRASAYCATRSAAKAELIAAMFDHDGDLATQLKMLRPDILVDASGPFQAYGDGRYRVIEACIANGVNYLDLADGSDFVTGVNAFDRAAIAAGLYVLSGLSSFPVLTAAVVRRLSLDMTRMDAIRAGLAPSPHAALGENVIRAMASYAGQPIPLTRDGLIATGHPFTDHMRVTIAPPGQMPLHNRLFSLIDVPDLRILPALWPEAKTVWIGAGPVPEVRHRALIAAAWLVRLRVITSLLPFASLMHFTMKHLRRGEHRSGMFVAIEGADASDARLSRSWHLIAEGDEGPLIPAMPVAAVIRKVLDGDSPPPGARDAVNDVDLDDYERLFADRRIHMGIRSDAPASGAPLYKRILGTAFDDLPDEIRAMHDVAGVAMAEGRARVDRGGSLLARLAAAVIGFPAAIADTPVSVMFSEAQGEETWRRTFGSATFASRQFAGRGRSAGLLCERFGILTFAMALVVEEGRLALVLRRWSALGIPLPMWLCPRSHSYETVEEGRFRFHVEIGHPLTGLIVRYQGWLVSKQAG